VTRIVFSRKGFDSSFGGCPSPILHGRPVSLPIPTRQPTPLTFADLRSPIPELVEHLTRGRLGPDRPCHLDPDIDRTAVAHRPPGWRGALGQVAAARAHLANQKVGPGDLFLFWGLFRPVDRLDGRWRYVGRPVHAIFGWLQVAHVYENPGGGPLPDCPWLDGHPHTQRGWGSDNEIFVAGQHLTVGALGTRGYGVLQTPFELTAPDAPSPSIWRVPEWLHVDESGTGMTYHPQQRWLPGQRLRSAARGQEFVANIRDRHDALAWAAELIEAHQ
jgi:hypothetical protein